MKKILIVEDESLVAHHLKLILNGAGYKVCGISESVSEALSTIETQKPDLVLLDIHLKGTLNGIDLARKLTEFNIAFVYLTANFQGALLEEAKSTMPYGFIVKPFREADLLTTLDVAFYRYQNNLEAFRLQEFELNQKLKGINYNRSDIRQTLLRVASILQPYIPFDYLNFVIKEADESTSSVGFLRIGFDEYQILGTGEFINIFGIGPKELDNIFKSSPIVNKAKFFNADEFDTMCDQNPLSKMVADGYDFESALFFPVLSSSSELIRYEFYNRKSNTYSQHHITLLSRIINFLGDVLGSNKPVSAVDEIVRQPSNDISTPIKSKESLAVFDGIVGQSPAMLSVFDQIAIISPLDTSVLILGESGTGKERVAKSIHSLSARKNKPLIVVNCASLPANLVESELFGHEKGSYTGASERRIGKFEQANGGTIFLDEIGELTVDLQIKLLRVLQEREIERVGGKGPIKIDVRIIAATNRDLEQEMEEGRFRLDLYYRLFVFPIEIPSLRERTDDIRILADHFVTHYSKKYNKPVTGISQEVLDQMLDYPWPGNVRELEHFIERSILMAKGTAITEVKLPKRMTNKVNPDQPIDDRIKTIEENERDYIISVLKKCNGRIRGSGGAAEVTGLPPTTLHSKMKKLGIK